MAKLIRLWPSINVTGSYPYAVRSAPTPRRIVSGDGAPAVVVTSGIACWHGRVTGTLLARLPPRLRAVMAEQIGEASAAAAPHPGADDGSGGGGHLNAMLDRLGRISPPPPIHGRRLRPDASLATPVEVRSLASPRGTSEYQTYRSGRMDGGFLNSRLQRLAPRSESGLADHKSVASPSTNSKRRAFVCGQADRRTWGRGSGVASLAVRCRQLRR
jgi:hypothetical protein